MKERPHVPKKSSCIFDIFGTINCYMKLVKTTKIFKNIHSTLCNIYYTF